MMDELKKRFYSLQEKAQKKLADCGYEAKRTVNVIDKPGIIKRDPEKNIHYGIAYGALLYPLSLSSFIDDALETKKRDDLMLWLKSHGAYVNFAFVNTGEKYTEKKMSEVRKVTEEYGVYLPEDNAELVFGLTLVPEKEPLLNIENFPDFYESFCDALQQYIDGSLDIIFPEE